MAAEQKYFAPAYLVRTQAALCGILFFLVILGAGVRLAHAGLACPDWPLCLGSAVPKFNFEIFMEWIHRVVAMSVGFIALFVSGTILSKAELRRKMGSLVFLSLALFAIQAFLGRVTVTELLNASIVNAHLMGGYSLFAINVWILMRLKYSKENFASSPLSWEKIVLPVVLLIAFLQATVGGTVSSHYAGLACPDFPTCNGLWWPGFNGQVGIKFAHRLGAFILFALLIFLTLFAGAKNSKVARKYLSLATLAVALQVIVGVSMVFTQLHPALSLLHSALAIAIFSILLLGNFNVYRN